MHIKNIHCMIEKLAECAKMELDKGIENVNTKEMGEVIDMLKDLSEAEYYAKISKAMEESEYSVDYDEHGRRYYRGQPRDSMGRYMSRRGYEDYMMPDYRIDNPVDNNMVMGRDMDRRMGRMYYTESHMGHGESRYEKARRGYEETKAMHKDNTPEDKQHKMRELENYTKELAEDVTDMVNGMSAEEKNLLRSKMQMLIQKI